MISLTGILSLLSALAATSYALSCTQCASQSKTCSDGIIVTCQSGYKCGSIYSETTAGLSGVNFAYLLRSCLPSSECNFKGSITNLQQKTRMVTSCCETDNCIPTIPALPTQSSDPNGVVCRSCFSGDSTWCYTSDTIKCTGDENMCLLQSTQTTGLTTAIRGCATKSYCELGVQSRSSTGAKVTCTSGGISVRTVVLTPAIACLLLLKSFF
ncbi:phospholipase A2 inhibitor and Ly6/PLAUR domain-containing protein-like [Hyla sarda]|uniref:phospholipase A2 inhibitor and Ly6/PLAUR domain-containing protein-like n=1 Tax=Hyla sarda TaxID=327740 RepID=UPI0024C3B591|nr:phospholipase A2 inhibitor and Ly6/PLAUR domain-containing protein-like [Hyla sarda]